MSDAAPPQPPRPLYLVATDDGGEDHRRTREAGLDLAERDGARVLLYDRTSESLLTEPYPAGPWSDEDDDVSKSSELDPETLEGLGRGYLADQLRAARARGLDAHAFMAEGVGGDALADAVERFAPDLLVLPASMVGGGLTHRLRGETPAKLHEKVDVPLRLVDEDGGITEG